MTKKIALFFVLSLLPFYWLISLPEKSPKKIPGSYKALNFWSESREYPDNSHSANAFFNAFQQRQFHKSAELVNESVPGWENMGPENVAGRMLSLAINPKNSNTLYAGSASGGLWRTYNATTGKNWNRVAMGYPVLGIMAIAIDPVDTSNIFVGTGEVYGYQKSIGGTVIRTTRGSYGLGILKSEDGGKTWHKSLDWTSNQQRGVQCLEINPENHKSVYAGTSEGVYKSNDGGDSWALIFDNLMVQDIVIHSVDTSKIIVSCGNLDSEGSGLYRSLNSGESWNKLSGIPKYTGKTLIEMYKSNPDIVFASVANSVSSIGLYKTENFGNSWSIVHTEDVQQYQGFFAHWVAVHPHNVNEVVHAGVRIYKSTNGGSQLTQINGPHVDHHNYAHDPQNPGVLYIANDGGVYRSANFGNSYTDIGRGIITAQFYNGFSSSSQDSSLAMGGLQDNNTVITYGSKDWQRRIGGDGSWSAINSQKDNILYGSWQNNNILKSVDRGSSFTNAVSGINEGGAAFIAPFVISESNPNILYSGRKSVFKTEDGAENWFQFGSSNIFDGNPILSMAVSPQDPNTLMIATAPIYGRSHVYRYSGNSDWVNITGSLPDRYPMDIAIDPADNKIAYIVYSGYGSGHVFKTTTAGSSWKNITGSLPDLPTHSVVIDPQNTNHIYVGNDLTVYFSPDGGALWMPFDKSLPEAVIAMDLNISKANRKLRVATHGNGAWQRPLVHKTATALERHELLPQLFTLGQNFPNPFNPATTIKFSLSANFSITLIVYDLLGREVKRLRDGYMLQGQYNVGWDGKDNLGKPAASGVYIYSLSTAETQINRKMMLVR